MSQRRFPIRRMGMAAVFCALLCVLPVLSTGRAGFVAAQETPSDSYAKRFDVIWNTTRDKVYDPALHGVDWNKIGDAYRAKLPGVKSRAQFADLMNRMLEELHLSHTGYFTEDEMEFYMLPAVLRGDIMGKQVEQIGVTGKETNGEFVVSGVLESSPAEKAGIRSGDHLLTADGQPFATVGPFRGKEGQTVPVTLRREGSPNVLTVSVTPYKKNVLRAFWDATSESAGVIENAGKKLGYVHLWTMAHTEFRDLLEQLVLGKLYATDGLILDLRDGYGGFPNGFGDVFYRPDIVWQQQMRSGKPTEKRMGYARPVVVLINGGTRSAKEYFAYQLKTSHRAELVGTRTAGAFLGAISFPVEKDGVLELPVLGLKLDGKPLENVGVTPDVEVAASHAYTASDAQLARAQQVLLEAICRRAPEAGRVTAAQKP